MNKTIDTSRWDLKVSQINILTPVAVARAVDFGLDEMTKAVLKNLSGPSTAEPGFYPVPRRTGDLARSVSDAYPKRFSPEFGAVGSSHEIAGYNKAVHDGTKYHKPRRFIADAARERRDAIKNRMRYEVLKEIRKVGQN